MVRLLLAFLLGSILAVDAVAQTSHAVLNDIAFGTSMDDVRGRVGSLCASIQVVSIDPPRLPVVGEVEERLVCEVVQEIDAGSRITFHFGDDRLAMIELAGPMAQPAVTLDIEYVGFRAAMSEGFAFLADESLQVAWIMPPENMHAHPFLGSAAFGLRTPVTASARVAGELKLGGTIAESHRTVVPLCYRTSTRRIEPPRLPMDVADQVQIDCLGFPYLGFPRKVELVFADDRLVLSWILTGKPEEGRVRAGLIEAYGQPTDVTETWEVFEGGTVLLRKDTPEVLYTSEGVAKLLRGN
jgi:hypothetical protein